MKKIAYIILPLVFFCLSCSNSALDNTRSIKNNKEFKSESSLTSITEDKSIPKSTSVYSDFSSLRTIGKLFTTYMLSSMVTQTEGSSVIDRMDNNLVSNYNNRRKLLVSPSGTFIKSYSVNVIGFENFEFTEDSLNSDLTILNDSCVGISETLEGETGIFTMYGKINQNGSYIWAYNIYKPNDDESIVLNSITSSSLPEQDLVFCGDSVTGIAFGKASSADGSIDWVKEINGNNDEGNTVIRTKDDKFACLGRRNNTDLLFKFDEDGIIEWTTLFDVFGTNQIRRKSLIQLDNGCYIVESIVRNPDDGNNYLEINKFFENGTHSITRELYIGSKNGLPFKPVVPTSVALDNSTFAVVGFSSFAPFIDTFNAFYIMYDSDIELLSFKLLAPDIASYFSVGSGISIGRTSDSDIILTLFNFVTDNATNAFSSLEEALFKNIFTKIDTTTHEVLFTRSIDESGLNVFTVPKSTEDSNILVLSYGVNGKHLLKADPNGFIEDCLSNVTLTTMDVLNSVLIDFPVNVSYPNITVEDILVTITPISITDTDICVPTNSPTFYPTYEPSFEPTKDPTSEPTKDPTSDPTEDPTSDPTEDPTSDPTEDPTSDPTEDPTSDPTEDPTSDPTKDPTSDPTEDPTSDPTKDPTSDPTKDPTSDPTKDPTSDPTKDPTQNPTSDPTNSDDAFEVESEDDGFSAIGLGLVIGLSFIVYCFIFLFLWCCLPRLKDYFGSV